MAVLAKGLPIVFIPEKHPIAPVRNDVVDHGGRGQHAVSTTVRAKRVLSEVQRSGLTPSGVVPPDIRTATQRVAAPFLPVIFAIYIVVAQIGAAGMPTWTFRFSWHLLTFK